jgi:acetyl esterase/lipase
VPIGYLAYVMLVAVCAALAVAPPRPRHSSPFNATFLFTLVVNELPFMAFYVLLGSTAVEAVDGDLATPVGIVAAAIAAATTVGLVVIARRAFQARAVLDAAIDTALGPANRSSGRSRRHRWARILLWPFATLRVDVERVANIPYGDAGRHSLLDLYRPRFRPPDGPTLVYFHGGAFRSGHKRRGGRPLIHTLASQGWVCISANYGLTPAATFPDQLVDAKRVLAWVREHGEEYGADASVVYAAGSSAGGHLAATAALTPNDPRFQPGFERDDTSISAVIMLGGYYGAIRRDGPALLAARVHLSRGAAVLRRPWRQRHHRRRRRCQGLRRRARRHVVEPGRVRRAPRRPTCLRPVPLDPVRDGDRRNRSLRRLGDRCRPAGAEPSRDGRPDVTTPAQTGYAPVNGLEMYYEIHREGRPLVLLPGAYMPTTPPP